MHLQCPVLLLAIKVLELYMNRQNPENNLILGVDTHLDINVAVLINPLGQVIATSEFEMNTKGYEHLYKWCYSFGIINFCRHRRYRNIWFGVISFLNEEGITILEVNRPNRAIRRLRGKSDPTDAESAARAVLSNEAKALPKSQGGAVEAMRFLLITRRSAVKAKTQSINQIRAMLVTAPDEIRTSCFKSSTNECIAACLSLQSNVESSLIDMLIFSLTSLADRWKALKHELAAQKIKESD